MFFDESRPDRAKRAKRAAGPRDPRLLESSPIPPAKSYELMTLAELYGGGDRTLVMDTESYPNYWLAAFKCVETKKVFYFENSPDSLINLQLLQYVMTRFRIITFNGNKYDIPMIQLALQGLDAWKLKEINDDIIGNGLQRYQTEQKYGIKAFGINHIDLIEVAPITASLKAYAGRLHCERMQDLPYSINTNLSLEQAINVRDYCINDLDNTELLFESLAGQIDLRELLGKEYKLDLRSKSDAQIAEAVIKSELEKLGVDTSKPEFIPNQTFYYQVPDFIRFKTPQFQEVLRTVATTLFEVGDTGKANCPPAIKALNIKLGSSVYKMGNGGLHSSEKATAHVADGANHGTLLIDRDVASYYPNIVLNQGLYPAHLGPAFLEVYRAIVKRRLDAKHKAEQCKRDGDKEGAKYWAGISDALKITINGAFGKLGSQYSRLYSSDLMSQVTITGQLCLLMLIEAIELAGIPVVSANTDGIVIKCPAERYADLETLVIAWEEQTGFVTEEARYKALYCRDVNNYLAVKLKSKKDEAGNIIWLDELDGCKTKGVYSERGSALNSVLSKNPECLILSDAVQALLLENVPVADTILNSRDLRRFVSVRTVKGGAEKDGVYLGKAIRWYYACGEDGVISSATSGNKVPQSEGAKPMMVWPEAFPNDLDFDRYIAEANDILYKVGYYTAPKVGALF